MVIMARQEDDFRQIFFKFRPILHLNAGASGNNESDFSALPSDLELIAFCDAAFLSQFERAIRTVPETLPISAILIGYPNNSEQGLTAPNRWQGSQKGI
jgi:hypothetical protein